MSYYGRLVIDFIDARGERPVVRFLRCEMCGLRHHRLEECGGGSTPELGVKRKVERPALPLTEEQRFLILRGVRPRLTFSARKPAPVEAGYTRPVTPQVELEVLGVKRSKKASQWEIEYTIRDARPLLLRRVPPTHAPRREDQTRPPSRGDIEVARLESSYTHSSHGAITDAGEDVPAIDHNLLSMAARSRWAERPVASREMETQERAVKARLHSVLRGLEPAGRTALLAGIQRLIEEQEAEERQAA